MYSTAPATSLFSLGRVSPAITAHQWGQANQVPASHSCIWSAGVFQGIGGKPTFPGTWEWVVLPDMGGTFDQVEERLLAGSSLFLFSIVVSIPTCHVGDRGSIPTISQKRRTSSTLGRQPITPEPKHLHI